MTPNDIDVLLHYHICPQPHPRVETIAVQDSIEAFMESDILKSSAKIDCFETTERGAALVRILCNTPYPTYRWVDKNGDLA